MKRRKGQAAIEFLTTYSWAIMGILLTIGALAYFDVFNTNRFIAERCETGAQISCVEAVVTTDGTLHIRLANNYPVNITITSVNLTISDKSYTQNPNKNIERGSIDELIILTGDSLQSSKETINIEITFRRTTGVNPYVIKGVAVLRPIAPGLL